MELAAAVAAIAAWAVAEAVAAHPDRPERGTLALPTGLVLLAGQLAGVAEHLVTHRGWPWGVAAIAAGAALRVWAIVTLGAGFSTRLAPAVEPIRRGPYRVLRHPSEIGLLVAAAGVAIALGSLAAALAAAALVPLSVVRASRESRAAAARTPGSPSRTSRHTTDTPRSPPPDPSG